MAENEYSVFWSTGTSADGADAYTSEKTRTIWRASFSNGVWKDYLNSLAVTTTGANNITVATGAANIQGFQYFNTGDAVSKTVSTPSTGATGLRVVVRLDWVGTAESAVTPPLYDATTQYTARVLVIKNADGTAAIPDATTTDGSAYDLTLATGTIAQTTGIITLTDARTYATSRLNPRTRSFFIHPASAVGSADFNYSSVNGAVMSDTAGYSNFGSFIVPYDYVSGLTVSAVLNDISHPPIADGNIRVKLEIEYATIGEEGITHLAGNTETTVAVTKSKVSEVLSTALPSATAGDIVRMHFQRDGADPLDTFAGGLLCFAGFKVTYTAAL